MLSLVLSLVGTGAAAAPPKAKPAAYVLGDFAQPSGGSYSAHHLENLRLAGDLLRNGFRVYWLAETADRPGLPEGIKLRRGDFLVPLDQPDAAFLDSILDSATRNRMIAVREGATFDVYPLGRTKVLLDAQPWTGNYNWYYDTLVDAEFELEHLYDAQADSFDPDRHNLFVAPGGGGRIPAGYNQLLKGYVAAGGNFLGSCWGAAQALYPSEVSYGTGNGAGLADAYNAEVVRSFGALGGIGHIVLRNEAPHHPVLWGLPQEIHNIYWNGPVMRPGPGATVLASFVDVAADEFQFHVKDTAQRHADIVEERGKCLYLTSQRPGEGKVTVFGCHPEASSSLNPFRPPAMGPRVVYNAILYSTAGPRTSLTLGEPATPIQHPSPSSTPPYQPDAARLVSVRETAAFLRRVSARLLGEGAGRFTEDDPTGFFLLRSEAALANIEETVDSLVLLVTNGDGRYRALRERLDTWTQGADGTIAELADRLPTLNPRRMNRRDAGWQPIVGPLFDCSLELTLLKRDLDYHNAFVRRGNDIRASGD